MSTAVKLDVQYFNLIWELLGTEPIHTGEWQSKDTADSKAHATYELINVTVNMAVPDSVGDLQELVAPNLPWAENHFHERVGGEPLNPGYEYKNWPWFKGNVEEHQKIAGQQFSHTYMERFWPKRAAKKCPSPEECRGTCGGYHAEHKGIRFTYGDLQDVLDLIIKKPLTRQAYLPVWFPEDTGAVHGERVPCSLGYHFLIRPNELGDNELHCWYSMRSCDILRHFRDDVYLAGRLMQWLCKKYNGREFTEEEINNLSLTTAPKILKPGNLHMTISSLHAFVGDKWKLEQLMMPSDNS